MKSSLRLVVFVTHIVSMSYFIGLISANCEMPDHIPNTISTLSNQTLSIGSYIIWECREGYMMQGDTNTAVWVCLEDGTWLGRMPICKAIECPSPPIAAYSMLDPPLAEAPVVNQTIAYTCSSDEYTLIGQSLNRCLRDGTWENHPPICQRNCGTADHIRRYSHLTCYRRRGNSNQNRPNWSGALDLCDSNGETLATVKDVETQAFLVQFVSQEINNDVWIGVTEGRDWMWRHSDKFIERFFWPDAFPNANLRDCIQLSRQSDSAKFSWNPRSLYAENGLLCQYDQSCQSTGLNQSDTVLDYMGNCFQFLVVSLNWTDGALECERRGGYLAEIFDESTNDLLAGRASYLREDGRVSENTAWWIGGYDDDDSERSWYWSDKTRMIFEAWNPEEPNGLNSEECVEMRKAFQYKWNDRSCPDRLRALCQIGIPACGDPGQPLNGYRLPDDRTTYSVGATLYFTCEEGYRLLGADILKCLNNGSWDQPRPTCTAVDCPGNPPLVPNVSNLTLGSSYQDITVYTCKDGNIPNNEPISFCQHNGTWSTPNFTCTAISPCYSNPCMNGGTCSVLDGSSFTCTCPSSYTGLTCHEENPGGASSPSAAIAAGSTLAVLLILVVIILSVVLLKRRRTGKPVPPHDENEMENYAAVANCYEDKPVGSTPHTPYYLTVVPDNDENGGFANPVAKQPFPHLQKGGEQKKQPPQVNGSGHWNATPTDEGFVDNVLYGTSDEQPEGLPSLHSTPNGTKPGTHAKKDTAPTFRQTTERRGAGNAISGIPTADDNVYGSYEDAETLMDNVLYNATPSPTSGRRQFDREVDGTEEVYENPDESVYADCENEETLIDNVLYNSSSPTNPRASKHNAVVDQGNGEVYENPDDNVYEAYEDEGSVVENELYSAATPPTPRADKSESVTDEGSGEVYQNSEFHEVPTNLITNELYKSVSEI